MWREGSYHMVKELESVGVAAIEEPDRRKAGVGWCLCKGYEGQKAR